MNITENRCGQELLVETQQVCAGTDTNGQNEQSFDFIVNGTRSPNPGFKTKGNNRKSRRPVNIFLRQVCAVSALPVPLSAMLTPR
ncbi:hypothetical protein RRG08_021219 [Elysia crispata]|uniref:Uncharacterized protein n=1 Tax=Elysia crispata TaxID=231223 RepID=A0AAE1D6L2_9GAST|nr:hypothetical protein RRG08_021219 [Elysia crispata]